MANDSALNILVITSRPLLTSSAGQSIHLLDVAEERRRIEKSLKSNAHAKASFVAEATTNNVNTALLQSWDVVHFTGHGSSDGRLLLEDGYGVAHFVEAEEIASLLKNKAIPLLVLSACYSETVAHKLLAAGLPAVIAIDAKQPIADQAAIIFAEHFYGGLANGLTVKESFDNAQRSVALDAQVGDKKPPVNEKGKIEQVWSQRFKLLGSGDLHIQSAHTASLSVMPVQKNLRPLTSNFVGRAKEIVETVKAFAANSRVAWWGSGGLGKTELAKAIAHWHSERARVDAVLWASASPNENEYRIRDLASLLSVARRVFKLSFTEQSLFDEQKQGLRDFCAEHKTLLILDNWETIEPQARKELWDFVLSLPEETLVLVTSRDTLPARDARNLELNTLSPEDAVELFIKTARNAGYFDRNPQLSSEEMAILSAICDRLSGYTLAVQVVAGQTESRTLSDIWQDLQRVPKNVLEGVDEISGEPRGVWTSMNLSYDVLPAPAQNMFRQMCVFLAPTEAADIAAITEIDNPRPVLDTLVKRSLVRMREGAYYLLPVIRDYAANKLSEAGQRPNELHLRAFNFYRAKDTLETTLAASDHLYELTALSDSREVAEFLIQYLRGFYQDLVTRGFWVEARHKAEQGIAIARALEDKQTEAQLLGELGMRYYEIGEMERASELTAKAQQILSDSGDKSGIASTLGQLGQLARTQQQWQISSHYFLEAYAIFEALHSPYRQLALQGIASVKDAVAADQFDSWLREYSPDPQRILALLDAAEDSAAAEQANRLNEFLVNIASAVANAKVQASAEERTALAAQLTQVEAQMREQQIVEVAAFISVLRGILLGEEVTEKIAALSDPLRQLAEQVQAA